MLNLNWGQDNTFSKRLPSSRAARKITGPSYLQGGEMGKLVPVVLLCRSRYSVWEVVSAAVCSIDFPFMNRRVVFCSATDAGSHGRWGIWYQPLSCVDCIRICCQGVGEHLEGVSNPTASFAFARIGRRNAISGRVQLVAFLQNNLYIARKETEYDEHLPLML